MNEGLSVAGQWAAILSPVVAVAVFAGSLFYDRAKRRATQRAEALAKARSALFASANWTTMPFPLSTAGGWPMRLFDAVSALAATIPLKKYGHLSIWLVTGVTKLVNEPTGAGRIEIQSRLSKALFEQTFFGRRGLSRALKFARENPWPESSPVPIAWRAITEVGAIALRLVAGDQTYARRRTAK